MSGSKAFGFKGYGRGYGGGGGYSRGYDSRDRGGYDRGYGQAPRGGYQGQRTYQTQTAQRAAQPQADPQRETYNTLVAAKAAEYFNSVLKLVLLPGGFPMCYAMGDCLVTDYEAWKEFKEACQKKAETIAKIEVYGEEPPPFSWGLRPVSPEKLHPIGDPSTKIWVWTFILANIAPYPAARNIFLSSLQKATNESFAHAVEDLFAGDVRVPEEAILDSVVGTLDDSNALTPGELAETYRVQDAAKPVFVNLALMQLSEARIAQSIHENDAKMSRIENQTKSLSFISSSSGSEAEDEPPAPPLEVPVQEVPEMVQQVQPARPATARKRFNW